MYSMYAVAETLKCHPSVHKMSSISLWLRLGLKCCEQMIQHLLTHVEASRDMEEPWIKSNAFLKKTCFPQYLADPYFPINIHQDI